VRNEQGNNFYCRDNGYGATHHPSYIYSNKSVSQLPLYSKVILNELLVYRNGSYFYSNSDGGTYYNNGAGYSRYSRLK